MSLYNQLFGVNPFTVVLLSVLSTTISNVPRFRDVYVDGDEIIIFTRTGGGNRDQYDAPDCPNPSNADLRKIPGYLRDEDDGFDETYAYFHYAIPERVRESIAKVAELTKDRPKPREAWDTMKSGEFDDRAKAVAENIARQILAGKTIIET